MNRRLGIGLAAILLLLFAFIAPVSGADSVTVKDSLNEIVSYYENNRTDLNEWEVIGLADAGVDLTADIWQLPQWNLPETSPVGDYAKAILAIKAIGQDPTDVDGRDLCQELADRQGANDGSFGSWFTDHIWAMQALDKSGTDYQVSKAIDYIIANQKSDGGYAIAGETSDPDTTGFTLMVLADHKGMNGVENAINNAKNCLQGFQLETAGFGNMAAEESPESNSAVIRGLLACAQGEIITDENWTRNGKTMIDALYAYQLEDKSFCHVLTGRSDRMATYNALLAITALVDNGFADYLITTGTSGTDPNEPSGKMTVTIRVEGIESTGTILEKTEIEIAKGGKLFEVLRKALDDAGIANSIDTTADWLDASDIEVEIPAELDGKLFWMYVVNDDLNTGVDLELNQDDAITVYLSYYTPELSTSYAKLAVDKNEVLKGDNVTITVEQSDGGWPAKYIPAAGVTVYFGDETYITDENGQVTVAVEAAGEYEVYAEKYAKSGIPEIVKTAKTSVIVETMAVTIRVEGIESTGTILEKTEIEIAKGSKLFEVLKKALDDAGIANSIDTTADWLDASDIDVEIPAELDGKLFWMYVVNDDLNTGVDLELNQDDAITVYLSYYTPELSTSYAKLAVDKNEVLKGDNVTITVEQSDGGWPAKYIPAAGVTVYFGDETYITDENGQAIVNVEAAGEYEVYAEKYAKSGIPEIVKTARLIITAKTSSSGSTPGSEGVAVQIAVVGPNGKLLYGPGSVNIKDDNRYGLTAMAALVATGLDYRLSDKHDGLIIAIAGLENEGMNGWQYKVNGVVPGVLAEDTRISPGDKIIFWYSTDAMSAGPNWEDLNKPGGAKPIATVAEEKEKEELQSYLNDLLELSSLAKGEQNGPMLILNADKMMTDAKAEELSKELAENKVSFSKEVGKEGTLIFDAEKAAIDNEVSLLIPENALKDTQDITIKEHLADEGPQQFAVRVISGVYEFGPSGTVFAKPVTISIKIPITKDMNTDNLRPAWYDARDQEWVPLPGIIDLERGLVVFEVDHFTKFAVISVPVQISFDDIECVQWAKEAIEILAGQGIISGTDKGFEPNRPITRAEFVKLIVQAKGYDLEEPAQKVFIDVSPSSWFAQYAFCSYEKDIITGYPDGTFRPGENISRNEIAVIFDKVINIDRDADPEQRSGVVEFTDKDSIPVWALQAVKNVSGKGLIEGYNDGSFKGDNYLTRAEAAVTIYRYLNSSSAHTRI